jgi:hypothetical protein
MSHSHLLVLLLSAQNKVTSSMEWYQWSQRIGWSKKHPKGNAYFELCWEKPSQTFLLDPACACFHLFLKYHSFQFLPPYVFLRFSLNCTELEEKVLFPRKSEHSWILTSKNMKGILQLLSVLHKQDVINFKSKQHWQHIPIQMLTERHTPVTYGLQIFATGSQILIQNFNKQHK